jgi:erythromycin esterase-like protein/C-terminal processing protease CtpA/Prc
VAAATRGAIVIGFGETAHRLDATHARFVEAFKYLVEREGVRVLALELPYSYVERAAEAYAATGGLDSSLQFMLSAFDSSQVVDLLGWVATYNREHPYDRVRVTGFDVQEPVADFQAVRAELERGEPGSAEALWPGLADCLGSGGYLDDADFIQTGGAGAVLDAGALARCEAGLDAVDRRLGARGDDPAAALARVRLDGARSHQRLARVTARARAGELGAADATVELYATRDAAMADRFLRLRALLYPDERAVAWGHVVHMLKHSDRTSAFGGRVRTFGTIVGAALGGGYGLVASLVREQTCLVPGQAEPGRSVAEGADSLEARVGGIVPASGALDLHAAAARDALGAGPFAQTLCNERLGALAPLEQYDAVLYEASSGLTRGYDGPLYERTLREARAGLAPRPLGREGRERLAGDVTGVVEAADANREARAALGRPGHEDLVASLGAVRARAGELATGAFHDAMAGAFLGQRDPHTTYMYPRPMACWMSYLPVVLDATVAVGEGATAHGEVVVGAVLPPRVADPAVAPAVASVALGDVVTAVDGRPAGEALDAWRALGAGSNGDAADAFGVWAGWRRPHDRTPLPAADAVTLTLRRAADGGAYDVTLPWLLAPNPFGGCGVGATGRSPEPGGPPVLPPQLPWRPSAEPTVLTARLDVDGADVAAVRLSSFAPASLTEPNAWLANLRDVLVASAGADLVIVDVRDNLGGQEELATRAVQLFAPGPVEPTRYRVRAGALNADLAARLPGAEALAAAVAAARAAGAPLTEPLPTVPPADANGLGRVAGDNVVVLANGRCFSACDVFTTSLQDNGVARVYGEAAQTAAGGAIRLDARDLAAALGPAAAGHGLLPAPDGASFRVAWGQLARAGASDGRLIEGDGTRVVPAGRTVGDVLGGDAATYRRLLGLVRAPAARRAPRRRPQ